jgi:hypothetical protein
VAEHVAPCRRTNACRTSVGDPESNRSDDNVTMDAAEVTSGGLALGSNQRVRDRLTGAEVALSFMTS